MPSPTQAPNHSFYNPDFDINLAEGEMAEQLVSMGLTGRVEVKRDFKARETGRVYVELSCKGRPSGINVTDAEFWFFILSERGSLLELIADGAGIFVSTERLRRLVDDAVAKGRVGEQPYGSHQTTGALVSLADLLGVEHLR